MTRLAALYDIHANLPALEAVLEDVRAAGAKRLVIGGDVVPGPMPRETIERLLELDMPVQFIHGNGDREVLAKMRGIETGTVPEKFRSLVGWVAEQLHSDHEVLLAGWPGTAREKVAGLGEVLFCHATPRNDTEIFTRQTAEERLVPVFEGVEVPLVVCGHTHMQFDRIVGGVRVVNAGSVGMSFSGPGAYWLLLGPEVELRRTDYDLKSAAERIRETDYPDADEFARGNVVEPPSEHETLAAFANVELT